jgi:hypothetical protein
MRAGRALPIQGHMPDADVFEFEYCPLRNATHKIADRSSTFRLMARQVWPAARRAERVELTDDGIEAWSLGGHTRLAWSEITSVRSYRVPFGRRTLHIRSDAGRIEIAPILPGYDEIRERVFTLAPVSD